MAQSLAVAVWFAVAALAGAVSPSSETPLVRRRAKDGFSDAIASALSSGAELIRGTTGSFGATAGNDLVEDMADLLGSAIGIEDVVIKDVGKFCDGFGSDCATLLVALKAGKKITDVELDALEEGAAAANISNKERLVAVHHCSHDYAQAQAAEKSVLLSEEAVGTIAKAHADVRKIEIAAQDVAKTEDHKQGWVAHFVRDAADTIEQDAEVVDGAIDEDVLDGAINKVEEANVETGSQPLLSTEGLGESNEVFGMGQDGNAAAFFDGQEFDGLAYCVSRPGTDEHGLAVFWKAGSVGAPAACGGVACGKWAHSQPGDWEDGKPSELKLVK